MWLMVKGKRDKMFTRGEHGIAGLAQSVERRAFNLVVVGSIPTVGILQNFRSKNINGFTQQYNSFHYKDKAAGSSPAWKNLPVAQSVERV